MTASALKNRDLSEGPSVTWSVRKRDRSRPHLKRKIYHFVSGMICFLLYGFILTREQSLIALASLGGMMVLLDVARLQFPALNRFGLRLFGTIMRREELRSLTGNSFYALGLFIIVLLFPKPVVMMSILFLAIGDPVAAVVGTTWGKTKILQKKSLEGALANLAASGLASFILAVAYFHLGLESALLLGALGGLVSCLAELIPLPVDDNLTIPVLSVILLFLCFQLFPLV
ncbi:MAG: SEC59/DGK1/VTE5 family protein [Bdellovibrionota bacterium]